MEDININDQVTVILTDHGKQILKEYKEHLESVVDFKFNFTLDPDSKGRYTTELWNLMFIFGKHMSMTQPQIFKNNNIKRQ